MSAASGLPLANAPVHDHAPDSVAKNCFAASGVFAGWSAAVATVCIAMSSRRTASLGTVGAPRPTDAAQCRRLLPAVAARQRRVVAAARLYFQVVVRLDF